MIYIVDETLLFVPNIRQNSPRHSEGQTFV